MALIEEHVLEVAYQDSPLRKLSRRAALNCCSKMQLRFALEGTGLNPEWVRIPWRAGWVKSPASVTNEGVVYMASNEYINRLALYSPPSALWGVIEENIEGPQYELDGVVINGHVHTFHPLLQHWTGSRIISYERVPEPPGLREATLQAIQALRLTDTCFCGEFRKQNGWKVIDFHARLGEDPGLPEKMADRNPLEIVDEVGV